MSNDQTSHMKYTQLPEFTICPVTSEVMWLIEVKPLQTCHVSTIAGVEEGMGWGRAGWYVKSIYSLPRP